ncbi:DNA/RNA non-specific endonuclease [Streptomyces chartreusis]|uniref:DNA/RNA non-specific endonuclease n=1 Tax=Streptomyces chartreusis TaxID=1969 RepID=UPI0038659DEC|nr:DNA/RNA non-specific endonuclease [Streptomyces chartreusis]
MADAAVKTQFPVKSEGGTSGGPTVEAAKSPAGPGGLQDTQRAAGNQAALQTVTARPPEPTGVAGQVANAVIELFAFQLTGVGPQQRIAAAAMRGFVFTLANEVSLEGVTAGLKELATPRNMAEFVVAYEAGSILGLISPVTDLFGIVVLAEQLNKMAEDLGRAVWEHPEEMKAKALALAAGFRDFLAGAGKNLSPVELLKHLGQVSETLETKAGEAGSRAAHSVVLHFSGKEEEQPAGPAAPPAGYAGRLEQWATETRKKLTNTQWSRLGYNIGYDVGAIVSNTLLFVFSFGAGEAVAAIGAELGKLGGLLARAGNVVKQVGAGITVIEDLIAALMSKPMKWLEPVLKPFFELLERLKTFLRELAGFVDKKAAKTAVTALEKHAAEAAAPDPPHAPKPTAPEPHPTPKPTTPEPHAAPQPTTAEPPVAHTAPPPKSAAPPKKGPSAKKSISTPKKTTTKTPTKKTAPPKKTAAPPKKKATPPKKKATSPKKAGAGPKKTTTSPKKKQPAATSSGAAYPRPTVERVGADDGRHPRVDPDPQFFNGQNRPHHHVTDQHDRPLMAEGWLRASKAPRHPDQRWGAEQMMGRLSGTEQGHLLASRFGGDGRIFNLSSLPRALNQGEIKALEDALAQEMKSGRRFYVQAYNDYAGVGRVPSTVEYRVFVDDGGTPRQIFDMTIYASH